ncbi:hypothetical protein LW135_00825 [Helicobacter sp. faydin-H20]|uniref:hypothetical protein n=1 Tax=Helicobacter anatolicus TaxID=2905874 RepID=UPI001E353267|nr:hypothetical protein [Helicobacter anatolicus]MCE3036376.1 hypothetical protein [Helicobacter anatolicus]
MFFKEITLDKALKERLISHSEIVFPSKTVNFNGGGGITTLQIFLASIINFFALIYTKLKNLELAF